MPEVFREGLLYGLISKEEVTALVDSIIAAEDSPDYFYIELSLARDGNEQIEILTRVVTGLKLPIVQRVMIGIAYQKVTGQAISRDLFTDVCRQVALSQILYPVEDFELFEFEFYDEMLFMANPDDFWDEKMAYVSRYAGFTLDNYKQWIAINNRLEEILNKEQAKEDEAAAESRKAGAKRARIKKRLIYTLMAAFTTLAFGIIILDYTAFISKTLPSKFEADLYQTSVVYLVIFVPYFMLRVAYVLWKRVRGAW
ncbi:hypothetical protein MgSA37_00545 [Mucilaginibacter gotjawali]|uniref:Uncharacterized protein n=1 Tax=Mucilaginibacter gotjawali TaxID=1550579 RepID=A0A0X8X2E1_9SPHI|nr:hypothetical protein MgSA37_00545 [Mucilaginibacter gotjawali]